MYVQKQKELQKQYDKQEKKLKELKAGGKSTKQAVSMSSLINLKQNKTTRTGPVSVKVKQGSSSSVIEASCVAEWMCIVTISVLKPV